MQKFNSLERMMLFHGFLPSLMLDFLGFILCQYFLSEHQLVIAVAALLLSFIAAIAISWKKDPRQIAETTLGKMMLSQATPVNLVICTAGTIIFSYGSWFDNYIAIGAGGLIVFASSQWSARKVKREVK
jgi:uncharacterized membrane protein